MNDLALVDLFLDGLGDGNTARTYRGHMNAWVAWCEQTGTLPAHPTEAQCRAFKDHLMAAGKSVATVCERCGCVRTMLQRHIDAQRIPGPNPWAHVPMPKRSKVSTTPSLTRDEQRALHQWCQANATAETYALVRLMGVLGLRVSEAIAFDLARLKVDGDAWRYRYVQKGERERVIDLDDATIDAIQGTDAWRTHVATHDGRGVAAGPVWLFPARQASKLPHMHPDTATRDVRAACRGAGVPPISPHGFRHAAITRALEATGGDVRVAQELAGHDSLDSTLRYDRRTRLQARGVAAVANALDGDA